MNRMLLVGVILTAVSGCTSIKVVPLNDDVAIKEICIEENKKVTVPDFVPVLIERFKHHGIVSKVVGLGHTQDCEYVLRYTALRSWDVTTYLSHAELNLTDKNNSTIASAVYHLRAKGGLTFSKFDAVNDKMNPVIDKMLNKINY